MQSRRLLLTLVLAPLVLAACGGGKTAATTTTPPTTTAVQPTTLTIVVDSISLTSVSHDQPPKGASKGDSIVFTDTLRNSSGPQFGKGAAAEVGSDEGTMSFTSRTTARLVGIATLPNGTIDFNGAVVVNSDGTISVAVVGGTGKYAHATGFLKVGKGTKTALNTYTLNFPGTTDVGPVA
jgi:hypothetical protein